MTIKDTRPIGSHVVWGNRNELRGVIVKTVKPGESPKGSAFDFSPFQSNVSSGKRDDVSYLVMVDRGEGKKPGLYWPLTSALRGCPGRPVKKPLALTG